MRCGGSFSAALTSGLAGVSAAKHQPATDTAADGTDTPTAIMIRALLATAGGSRLPRLVLHPAVRFRMPCSSRDSCDRMNRLHNVRVTVEVSGITNRHGVGFWRAGLGSGFPRGGRGVVSGSPASRAAVARTRFQVRRPDRRKRRPRARLPANPATLASMSWKPCAASIPAVAEWTLQQARAQPPGGAE